MNKKIFLFCLITISIMVCQEFNELDILCDYDGDGDYDCELFLQFGNNKYASGNFIDAVEQYMTMVDCKCTSGQEEYVFENLGRAFAKINKPDSSTWAFKQGLKSVPDNKLLLELAAWSTGLEIRNGNKEKLNDQLYFLERLLEIDPNDISALEKMSDAYKRNGMYQEQIDILDQWLKIDNNNNKAITYKKKAFEMLGKDASEVDKERWENEPQNLEYGISYMKSLIQNEDFVKASDVGEELFLYYDEDKRLLQLISDAYIKDLNDSKAAKFLEKLMQVDSSNIEYILKLSNVYLNLYDFEKAYYWANQSMSTNNQLGKCYFQRAEVLVQTAENFRSDDIDFCDRLVYDLAMDDYQKAYDNNNFNGLRYKKNLVEFGTTIGDWFLLGEQYTQMSPSSEECVNIKKSDCYSFIKNREVLKK